MSHHRLPVMPYTMREAMYDAYLNRVPFSWIHTREVVQSYAAKVAAGVPTL